MTGIFTAMSVAIDALVEVVGQLQPVVDARVHVHARPGAAAVEDRADIVVADVVRRDRADVGLGHLPDLLLERHASDDRADARLDRRIGGGDGSSRCRRDSLATEEKRGCKTQGQLGSANFRTLDATDMGESGKFRSKLSSHWRPNGSRTIEIMSRAALRTREGWAKIVPIRDS